MKTKPITREAALGRILKAHLPHLLIEKVGVAEPHEYDPADLWFYGEFHTEEINMRHLQIIKKFIGKDVAVFSFSEDALIVEFLFRPLLIETIPKPRKRGMEKYL